ncbi:HDIG domain-containing protein [Patescibacteria group bacterium]|nr:HDIG domain-containing protein [Patescibacteria group bacterium]
MISREQALKLLHDNMQSLNLRRHCYAVEAVMLALAHKFQIPNDKCQIWGVVGLVHDIDYEKYPDTHPLEGIKILKKENYPQEIIDAVAAHGWSYREGLPMPKNNLQWSLYCCDELTGFIVACALVRPEKKLNLVNVASIQKKWKQKAFAAGVKREQIEECEKRLGIPLKEFIEIALTAMQGNSDDLGL